jgi:flagellar basal body-associated protein FliL
MSHFPPAFRLALAVGLAPMLLAAMLLTGAPAARAAGSEGGEGAAKVDPYIVLDPLAVSLIDRGRLLGSLIVSASLEVPDAAKQASVQARLPRLHDGYLRAMTEFAETRISVQRPVDVAALGGALQRVTDKVLGDGTASILIGFASVRRE